MQKSLLVAGLIILVLGIGTWGCTPTPVPSRLPEIEAPVPPEAPKPISPIVPSLTISCKEAIDYLGETKTVQGIFYCTYRPDVRSEPTFCNCPVPYPNHDFTALIWGDERPIFQSCLGGLPEVILDKQEIQVKGLIVLYEGKAEIILEKCEQLTIVQ